MQQPSQEIHPERSAQRAGDSTEPRILHVVTNLGFDGGIEVWLLHLLRHIDRRRYPSDVLVLNTPGGALEQDFRALGCRVFYCPQPKPWSIRGRLAEILEDHGPYDILHSHVHHFGGVIVRAAAKLGIPVRIAHSRNDTRIIERQASLLRQMYVRLMRQWIRAYATHRLTISVSAAEDLFGPDWQTQRCTVIHSGRDFSRFVPEMIRGEARRSLGLPLDALVVGHVGRFHWRKNHRWIIEVADLLFRQEPRSRLILVGDGADEEAIRVRVVELGIADRVLFAGARDDVPRLMKNVMDVFLFPSHHEGLGVAVVEAQAAGLPCVIAEHLPSEIDVVPGLIQRLSLSATAEDWAAAVLRGVRDAKVDPKEAMSKVLSTDFNIERSVDKVAQVYDAARAELRPVLNSSDTGADRDACIQRS